MRSWWELGEWSGYDGSELAVWRITCPFCKEKGNFESVFQKEKKNPNSSKTLKFEVLRCGNCVGYVHVLWSPNQSVGVRGMHDFRVLPYPLETSKSPEHWPEAIQRYWLQAAKSIKVENWDAAVVMARSALQAALRNHDAKGRNLKEEITDLAARNILPPIMEEWSNEIRVLGNTSAHPTATDVGATALDARDLTNFLEFLLIYLYNLPKQISDYRTRRKKDTEE